MPIQAVLLLPLLDSPAKELAQHLEIDLSLGEHLGKEDLQLLNVVRENVSGLGR
jgi:hypothetical protein